MLNHKIRLSIVLLLSLFFVGCQRNIIVEDLPEKFHSDQALPTYEQWLQVEKGMHVDQVMEILGKPMNEDVLSKYSQDSRVHYRLFYGSPIEKSDIWPTPPSYVLLVNSENSRVVAKETPYGPEATLSKDGMSSTPIIMIPVNETVFNHYPRYVDIRWYPSSGNLPIRYEIEVSDAVYVSRGNYKWEIRKQEKIDNCYYVAIHAGRNRGRVRVRSYNNLGKSEWSDFVYFSFDR